MTEKQRIRIAYVVYTKVAKLKERFAAAPNRESSNVNSNSLGWFAQFEGSHEAIHMGMTEPDFKVGDPIRSTFEKVNQCPPSPNTNPTPSSNSSPSAMPSPAKPGA